MKLLTILTPYSEPLHLNEVQEIGFVVLCIFIGLIAIAFIAEWFEKN